MSYSGRKGELPVLYNPFIADTSGAVNALIDILAAVIGQNNSGEGQYIDISMPDSLIALNNHAAAFLVYGRNPDYESTIFNGGSIYDYYETKDGKFLSVVPLENKFSFIFMKLSADLI
jgi:alpha-methylacyl-CoA racemase